MSSELANIHQIIF